jgi:hypothetical protein
METAVSTELEQRRDPRLSEPGESERLAHIVWAPGKDAGAVVTEARIYGTPVEALCGKRWIPERDPKRYPLCPECKEIRDRFRKPEQ